MIKNTGGVLQQWVAYLKACCLLLTSNSTRKTVQLPQWSTSPASTSRCVKGMDDMIRECSAKQTSRSMAVVFRACPSDLMVKAGHLDHCGKSRQLVHHCCAVT